jgi:hypothetical protein
MTGRVNPSMVKVVVVQQCIDGSTWQRFKPLIATAQLSHAKAEKIKFKLLFLRG